MTIVITKKWLETCGTASLEGLLFEAGVRTPGPVTLAFEVDPVGPKGPELILAPDFMPACLLKSVVDLCKKGYDIRIEENLKT